MKFWRMKIQCMQDEGFNCSSHCMRAFVWDVEGSQSSNNWNSGNSLETLKIPHGCSHHTTVKFQIISRLVIKRGLKLMASYNLHECHIPLAYGIGLDSQYLGI